MPSTSPTKIALAIGLTAYALLVVTPVCSHDPALARAALALSEVRPALPLSSTPPDSTLPDTGKPDVYYYDERIGDIRPLPPAELDRYDDRPDECAPDERTSGDPESGDPQPDARAVKVTWKQLERIGFTLAYDEEIDMDVYVARYPKRLRRLAGEPVEVEGYVIPYDAAGAAFALSANPFASCFFCGRASPASVMTMELGARADYDTDDFRRFRGRLQLNADDPHEFYYVLEDATEID